jgi:hypothetical protein
VNDVEEFLLAKGALDVEHPGGTLLAHLRRTHDVLYAWGARPALRLAGLAHAAYGTDGFPHALMDTSARPTLSGLIGSEAEEIVYAYGSCDRSFTYPRLTDPEPQLRDRFTGEVTTPSPRLVRDLVELTFANELDVLAHNEDLRTRHGDSLRSLFIACKPYASEPAYAAFTDFFAMPS